MAAGAQFKNQKGVVLLILIVVILLAASSYYISGVSINRVKTDKKIETQTSLKKAKDALIAYAVANWEVEGSMGSLGKLPCPDYNNASKEGAQDAPCGKAYANSIGYLPWRTLGLDVPKDGVSCMLYAVSPAYKKLPVAALNPDSYGQFQVVDENGAVLTGGTPEERPVAVIIAPGEPVAGQSRSFDGTTICGSDYDTIKNDLGAYLDNNGTTDNAALDTNTDNVMDQLVQVYVDSVSSANPINDRLITISHREIWSALQSTIDGAVFNDKMKSLTEALAICFANYGADNDEHLPMPASMDLNGEEYRWNVVYDDAGDFSTNFAGRLPYYVKRANDKLTNGKKDRIFHADNIYCDDIDLFSTAATDKISFSDDAGSDGGEFFDLWQNWKDHFFYAISQANRPSTDAVAACSSNCVQVNGNEYAGIIFFSGLIQNAQKRYTSLFDSAFTQDGDDDKDDAVNYLEENRPGLFPDPMGNGIYESAGAGSNDIMFCIKTDMSVVEC